MPKKTPEELARSRAKSNANLKRGNPATQIKSGRDAIEKAKKSNEKQALARKETRTYRELLELVQGSKPVLTPRIRDILIGAGLDPDKDNITNALVATVACSQKANAGDVRAYNKILEVTRQDPRVLMEQERIDLERESLKQGVTGYSALDEAFARLAPVVHEPDTLENGSDNP